jgi:hypothetical protein
VATPGHSRIGPTMDTDAHVMPIMQRDAADLLDAFVTGGSRPSRRLTRGVR